jgi:hypothetical protein
VEKLLDHYETRLTRYEEWVIQRQLRKIRYAIRRENTLNNVMRIVINDKTDEEKRREERVNYMAQGLAQSTGTISGTLMQHAAAHNTHVAHVKALAAQQSQTQYASGYVDARSYWTGI